MKMVNDYSIRSYRLRIYTKFQLVCNASESSVEISHAISFATLFDARCVSVDTWLPSNCPGFWHLDVYFMTTVSTEFESRARFDMRKRANALIHDETWYIMIKMVFMRPLRGWN
jgi:hypothetical protein